MEEVKNNVKELRPDQPSQGKPIIHSRLFQITRDCESIPKTGYNKAQNYEYIKAVDVIREVRKLMIKYGVGLSIDELDIEQTDRKNSFSSLIKCEANWYCVENPLDNLKKNFYTSSSDSLDKDIFKAKTNGRKYLFIEQFNIDTDDGLPDTENDGHEPRASKQNKQREETPQRESRASIKQIDYVRKLQFELGEKFYEDYRIDQMSTKDASDSIEELQKELTKRTGRKFYKNNNNNRRRY